MNKKYGFIFNKILCRIVSPQLMNWQHACRGKDMFSSLTPSVPQYNGWETAVQMSGEPQKTQSHTWTHTHTLWAKRWQCVTSPLLSARCWKRRREGEMRGETKRSLMIKLSPDLVFDRGTSCAAMTRRSQTHAHTQPSQVTSPIMTLSGNLPIRGVCVWVCERAKRLDERKRVDSEKRLTISDDIEYLSRVECCNILTEITRNKIYWDDEETSTRA